MTESSRIERLLAFWGMMIIASVLLFYHLDVLPLRLWDEGRRAVNALEMSRGEAHLLVPTFMGSPDHWGTKPPLLVWMQALGMKLLGPSVLAVRLPAALAALGTCWLLFIASVRRFDSPWGGVVAALSLLATPLYLGSHAARSGDFDALLVCWSTGMILVLYQFLETRQLRALVGASIFFTLGLWTKGVAAGFFLPALVCWTWIVKDHRFVWRDWRVYFALLAPIVSIAGYYLWRAQLDPGFLQLLWENELGGRYHDALEGHDKDRFFYLRFLFLRQETQAWAWIIPFAITLLWSKKSYRRFTSYLFVLASGFLFLISSADTKLFWYALPVLPIFALLAGGGVETARWAVRKYPLAPHALLVLVMLAISWPVTRAFARISATEHGDDYRSITVYGGYLPELADVPAYTVLLPSFNTNAVFATKLATLQGQAPRIRYLQQPEERIHPGVPRLTTFETGTEVVVCEMSTWLYMEENYNFTESHAVSPCKLLRVNGEK